MNWEAVITVIREAGVQVDPGLTDEEREHVEKVFGFRFPPDLAEFLQTGLPVSHGFVNWRRGECAPIRDSLDWPFDGFCKDIEENGFWLDRWGPMPAELSDRFRITAAQLTRAPKLIPLCGHRFLPEAPRDSGNPVFSVYQADVLVYGFDLGDYLQRELDLRFEKYRRPEKPRPIPFWSDLASLDAQ